jgi:hypothetical protein
LVSPSRSRRCDCGHDFLTGAQLAPNLHHRNREAQGQEGNQGLGIVLGLFGGLIALALSYMFLARPKTRQGILMGFCAQMVFGLLLRTIAMSGR